MPTNPFHHTFTPFSPFSPDGPRRVVAAEAEWSRLRDLDRAAAAAGETWRVLVGVDVFEPWERSREQYYAFPENEDWFPKIEVSVCHGCGMWVHPLHFPWHRDLNCKRSDPKCDRVPRPLTTADVLSRLFGTIDDCPHLTFVLPTRSPGRVAEVMPPGFYEYDTEFTRETVKVLRPRPNLSPLLDASTPAEVDAGVPELLRVPCAVRAVRLTVTKEMEGVSLERWLRGVTELHVCLSVDGALNSNDYDTWFTDPETGKPMAKEEARARLRQMQSEGIKYIPVGEGCKEFDPAKGCPGHKRDRIDWLLLRGETGPDARPCPLHVMRRLIEEARAAGVPVWVEGLGSRPWVPADESDGSHAGWPENTLCQLAEWGWVRLRLRDPDGSDPAEWPEWARLRELPREGRG